MKKLFGGINLTWKKLILFAVITALYTGVMNILPITDNTSFRDIAVYLDCWIIFGTIIICNSKSPVDSALKCFVFFLISQPLIYLIQVPFSHMGWIIFIYYKYWFIWTLACLPMGFIGYYIKKDNILSILIILPPLFLLSMQGVDYVSKCMDSFPHHLLSAILCFAFVIIIIFNVLSKKINKILALLLVIISTFVYLVLKGGLFSFEFDTVRSLKEYNLEGEAEITMFSGSLEGDAILIEYDDSYNIRLIGKNNGKYDFTVEDKAGNSYSFIYYYDKEQKTVVLEER